MMSHRKIFIQSTLDHANNIEGLEHNFSERGLGILYDYLLTSQMTVDSLPEFDMNDPDDIIQCYCEQTLEEAVKEYSLTLLDNLYGRNEDNLKLLKDITLDQVVTVFSRYTKVFRISDNKILYLMF